MKRGTKVHLWETVQVTVGGPAFWQCAACGLRYPCGERPAVVPCVEKWGPHDLRTGGNKRSVGRRVVYIAAPLSADTPRERRLNLRRAARWVAWAARHQKVSPVATWIVLAQQWGETPENRAIGLACDVAAIARCHELWLVGGRVSSGMRHEAEAAQRCGVTVVDMTGAGWGKEPPRP